MPTCAEARPGTCPCCGAASQPVGAPLVIVGHGTITRQVRGPGAVGGAPEQLVITMRRYRCRACRAVLVVGPRGLVRRRWYGAGAIAMALSVYARGGTSSEARRLVSPERVQGASAHERWATLTRWIEVARRGAMFAVGGLAAFPRRGVAEQVVLALAARGGRQLGDDLTASAFAGAAIAA